MRTYDNISITASVWSNGSPPDITIASKKSDEESISCLIYSNDFSVLSSKSSTLWQYLQVSGHLDINMTKDIFLWNSTEDITLPPTYIILLPLS